jgi:hypothetical protein
MPQLSRLLQLHVLRFVRVTVLPETFYHEEHEVKHQEDPFLKKATTTSVFLCFPGVLCGRWLASGRNATGNVLLYLYEF